MAYTVDKTYNYYQKNITSFAGRDSVCKLAITEIIKTMFRPILVGRPNKTEQMSAFHQHSTILVSKLYFTP